LSDKKLKTGVIRQKILIPNSTPEQVYRALLSSKEHSKFTGSPAKVSARVGGKFTAWNEYISGRNIELRDGKMIVQEWQTTGWPEGYGPSTLRISLKKSGMGTELTMVQTKVPAADIVHYDPGWHKSYWEPLKKYFSEKSSSK
jgi:activator of HSP90 ATPase